MGRSEKPQPLLKKKKEGFTGLNYCDRNEVKMAWICEKTAQNFKNTGYHWILMQRKRGMKEKA